METDPLKRLRLEWRNAVESEPMSARNAQEPGPTGGAVELTITHPLDRGATKFIEAVAGGRPRMCRGPAAAGMARPTGTPRLGTGYALAGPVPPRDPDRP